MSIHYPKGVEPLPEEEFVEEEETVNQKLSAFVGELAREADRRVGKRKQVELRWIADLQQKHGRYDHETERKLTQRKKSRLFINQTRTKTNSLSARLSDILFPVDDRNWSIGPTPVPEMEGPAEEMTKILKDAGDTMEGARAREAEATASRDAERQEQAAGERQEVEEVVSEVQKAKEKLDELRQQAVKRSNLMQDEIHDQLMSCSYQKQARQVIEDGCNVGIGVMKGPVVGYKPKARWKPGDDGTFNLQYTSGKQPAMYRVDYWGFFPDPDCPEIEDGDGIYERHLMNKKQVRQLSRRKDIDKDALRRVLKSKPSQGANPTYLVELNEITGQKDAQTSELYQVWEFTGTIDGEQIETLVEAFGDQGLEDIYDEDGSIDPLAELNVRIWFCENEILSFGLNPLDSGECLYSMFTLEPDENGPFGFGIPYLMRNPQALLNASFRMMSDNAGISAAPQIVINESVVEPVNGEYILEGGKLWRRKTGDVGQNERPFESYDIPMHQAELANMITLSLQMIDDATFPAIAQGEQGSDVTKTAQGMAMLMNSANIVFRRWVKHYDDGITKPDIRRMYHFNMQFSDKEEIKGDFEVNVRGSSVLLVREIQSQNILMIVDRYSDHPVYGPMLKEREAFEHLLRSNMLPVDEMLRSRDEYEQEIERRRQQPSPEVQAAQIAAQEADMEREMKIQELQVKQEMAAREWDTRLRIAQIQSETEMHKLAEALNMKVEDIQAKLDMKRADINSSERKLAVEAAMAEKTGEHAGGAL